MTKKLDKDLFDKIMADLEEKATYNESVYLTAIREVLESYVGKDEGPTHSVVTAWSL